MAFSNPQTVTRLFPPVSLPGIEEGDWIDVASVYTSGMRRIVMSKAMQVHVAIGNGASAQEGVSIDAFTLRQALLEEVVRAWSDSVPVTPDALAALPIEVADWISEQFDALAAGRSEDVKKGLSASSASGPPPTKVSPASSSTSPRSAGSGSTA